MVDGRRTAWLLARLKIETVRILAGLLYVSQQCSGWSLSYARQIGILFIFCGISVNLTIAQTFV